MEKQYGTSNGHSKWTHLIYGNGRWDKPADGQTQAFQACRHQGYAGQAEHALAGARKAFSGQG